jgi:hypothetical protein
VPEDTLTGFLSLDRRVQKIPSCMRNLLTRRRLGPLYFGRTVALKLHTLTAARQCCTRFSVVLRADSSALCCFVLSGMDFSGGWMKRNNVLFWISIAWFAALCGVTIWFAFLCRQCVQ